MVLSDVLVGIGGGLYAMIIATLTSFAVETDANKKLVAERMEAVSSYVRNKE